MVRGIILVLAFITALLAFITALLAFLGGVIALAKMGESDGICDFGYIEDEDDDTQNG